jgi:mRNA-capping enzyme
MFAFEEIEDDDQAGGSTGDNKKKKRREVTQLKAAFMDGIPNVKPVADMDVTIEVQKRIKSLTGFKQSGFPGCQPVSMDRKNITLLQKPYMVSWKADGTR